VSNKEFSRKPKVIQIRRPEPEPLRRRCRPEMAEGRCRSSVGSCSLVFSGALIVVFGRLARSGLQVVGRDLELAGGRSTRSSALVVGVRGGEQRLLVREAELQGSSSADRGGGGGRAGGGWLFCFSFPSGHGGEGVVELRAIFDLRQVAGAVHAVAGCLPRLASVAMVAALEAGSRLPAPAGSSRSSSPTIIRGLVPVITLDSTVVGLPLHRCFTLCAGSPPRFTPSGASLVALLQAGAGGGHRSGR
jgi:hypothetical protein